MTLQASGAISLGQVNTERGLASTALITMNDAGVRTLFGIASGSISLSQGYGKSNVVALSGQYNAVYQNTGANYFFSFAGVNFGTAGATRRVAITVSWNGGAANVFLSSATIGGIAATVLADNSSFAGWERSAIIYANVPSGTSGAVALAFSNTVNYGVTIGSFSIYGGSGGVVAPLADFQIGTNWNQAIITNVGDYVIAVKGSGGGDYASAWNIPLKYSLDMPATYSATAAAASTTATSTLTYVQCNNVGVYGMICAVAFR